LNIYADGRRASDSIISYNLLLLIVNGCHIFFFYMRNLGITFASTHNSTIKAKLGEVRRKGQTSLQLWARDCFKREKKRVGISYILDKNNSYYEMRWVFFFLSTNIHVNILKWIKKSKNLITKRSRIVLLEQWLEKKTKKKTPWKEQT